MGTFDLFWPIACRHFQDYRIIKSGYKISTCESHFSPSTTCYQRRPMQDGRTVDGSGLGILGYFLKESLLRPHWDCDMNEKQIIFFCVNTLKFHCCLRHFPRFSTPPTPVSLNTFTPSSRLPISTKLSTHPGVPFGKTLIKSFRELVK